MTSGGCTQFTAEPCWRCLTAESTPELGCHDLGPLAAGPIREIDRTVRARNMAKPHDPDVQLAMCLMDMPQSIATKYQDRLIADESAVGMQERRDYVMYLDSL
ncbi:hypothetical protein BDQ94DRAFT_176476 [Aspergillus welwitschiae]|uniref:Uncharacterized protein n=1 Tax=Aspergillus welwitschiae TaxID=1341132 RepID=A0A3F3PHE8_9EURO|nr:hypothetical protein BDQ94DRAFT_176476 [Aspergillus welwitschiae]RDH26308.1 hypothetical protein BDQ94DRAFT_176476 [Aspergillus welwitschiae]